MKGCPAVRATIASLIPGIALVCVLIPPPAQAEPRSSETGGKPGDALEGSVTEITQCDAENAVAREYGDAIERRDRGCIAEDGFARRLDEDLKGKLVPPVTGTLGRTFGEPDHKGQPSKGIVLRTRPGAQVVAPFDSMITFAGPYKDRGQLLILSARGGYHFVLAGMTKIYGVEAQKLLEGEPVGVMKAPEQYVPIADVPGATGTGDASSAAAGPELYFEIRKNHKPIDPLPWLATARVERTLR